VDNTPKTDTSASDKKDPYVEDLQKQIADLRSAKTDVSQTISAVPTPDPSTEKIASIQADSNAQIQQMVDGAVKRLQEQQAARSQRTASPAETAKKATTVKDALAAKATTAGTTGDRVASRSRPADDLPPAVGGRFRSTSARLGADDTLEGRGVFNVGDDFEEEEYVDTDGRIKKRKVPLRAPGLPGHLGARAKAPPRNAYSSRERLLGGATRGFITADPLLRNAMGVNQKSILGSTRGVRQKPKVSVASPVPMHLFKPPSPVFDGPEPELQGHRGN